MLYSLISSTAPSKYFSQTYVRIRTWLFVRPNTPDDNTSSTSARSASSLLITGCKFLSLKESLSESDFRPDSGSITHFLGCELERKHLIPHGVRVDLVRKADTFSQHPDTKALTVNSRLANFLAPGHFA